jgi:hypothetical protein
VTHYEITSLLLSLIGMLLIPVLVLLWRAAVNWTKLSDNVSHIIETNDTAHQDIVNQMAHDRQATNQRLRYLEEYFMNLGMRPRR